MGQRTYIPGQDTGKLMQDEINKLSSTYNSLMKNLDDEIKSGEIKITQLKDKLTVNMVEKILVLALSLVLAASLAFAQPMRGGMKGWKGSGGWGMGTQYQRMYNPKTVETITGTVESVDKITPMKGMNYGVHITVKTDKEAISVHLGPGWYIERLDTNIEKGDKVEVKGSRVTFAGKLAIIAAEVKKGDNVLTLRDSTGIPVWSGWRR